MPNWIKWILSLLVIILIGIGLVSLDGRQDSSLEVIKIGVIGPFSGNQAVYGDGVREGMTLAFEESSQEVNGRKIELIFEDTAGEVKNAVSAIQKLINIDKVSVLVSAGASQEAVAIAPIAEQNKVPMFVSISQAPELTDAGEYIFRGMPGIVNLAEKLAKASFEAGFRKVAILTADYNQTTISAEDFFVNKFEELGGQVVAKERFTKGVADFRTQLKNFDNKKPDLIFANGLTADDAIILKQKTELKLKQQFIGSGAMEDVKIIESAGKGSEGTIYASYNAFPPAGFSQKIEKRFGHESRRWNLEGYEAMVFLLEALKKSSNFDPINVQKGMSSVREFQGITQKLILDEKGNISRDAVVKIIKNGSFESYQK